MNKSWLVTGVLVVLSATAAQAQHYQPFADVARTYDMQLFAPGPEPELDGTVPPNEGVYFTYDRTYTSVSRPDGEEWGPGSDFAWGHRYDFGYITEDQNGWTMTVHDVSSPGQFFIESNVDRNGNIRNDLLDSPVGPVKNSINTADMWGIELNRIYRLKPTDRGTTFEPFFGVRYAKLDDHTVRQEYDVQNEGDSPGEINSYETIKALRRNEMIGGQLGLRAQSRRGRFVLSSELRAFAFQNFQTQNERFTQEELVDLDGTIISSRFDRDDSSYRKNTFVFGGELRVEAAFEFSREVAARVGLDVTEFARGIGRGLDEENDEDITMAGLTFGVTVNR